jgi:hypothetical protein
MKLMRRIDNMTNLEVKATKLRELLTTNAEVQFAMFERCEEESHSWEACCDILIRFYQKCKWCGKIREY